MNHDTHVIRKQFLHVELRGSELDGLALQRTLPAFCRDSLTNQIEQVLARFSNGTGRLYIEKLELDAGSFSLERLEQDLAEVIVGSLENALRELIPEKYSEHSKFAPFRKLSAAASWEEGFLYFLNNGSLPWNLQVPTLFALENALLSAWKEERETEGAPGSRLTNALRRALETPAVRQRLARQFSPGFLEMLLHLLSPSLLETLAGILKVVERHHLPPTLARLIQQEIWCAAFTHAVKDHAALPAEKELISAACQSLPQNLAEDQAMVEMLKFYWPDAALRREGERHADFYVTGESLPASNAFPIHHQHQEETEGIYINNAGLILLHPFLPQIFSELGYLEEGRIANAGRSLCLLHFLATGHTTAPEFELVFPKLLCNIPLSYPTQPDLELSTAETKEGEALLKAVIRHWSALGETSPDGLRGTYLLRAGKISLREDGDWLLQVEGKSFDILLDQLPWGLSMIKLPWMLRMVWVEWVY